ncbi:MAG: tRNA (adenosine(37)-N6)-dimethylallyltransferase MiaA [Bacteroidetes bacterium]|nr:MAG: tRNA (adenosine(37)-N6)-dimethylallyltransferase MiaA [Bacteroidota bacterium]
MCVVGPTAVGKTELGIKISKEFNAQIISADSRQIYKGMGIGTAAPTDLERKEVAHHFVDFLDPSEIYSAGDFERDVLIFLDDYFQTHDVAVMVGGSGLYVKGVIDGFDNLPFDIDIRKQLNKRVIDEGLESLVVELKALDLVQSVKMDLKNPQRVVRALEVCLVSGKPFSSFLSDNSTKRKFDIIQIGLSAPREEIRDRIAKRTVKMLLNGWVSEVKKLQDFSDCNSLKTVGYKELLQYLDGKCTLEEAQERIVISTRQFAKRQMTWFKKDDRIVWFDKSDVESVVNYCREFVGKS